MRGRKTRLLAAMLLIALAAFYGCSQKSQPTPFSAAEHDAAQESGSAQLLVVQLKEAKANETLRLIERDEQTIFRGAHSHLTDQ